ncbi:MULTISPECIES: hypothetical protein [unclassified Streptomyces]|uniref:hypothetical protein n=1 Tax=unclassified Streptomyces TaxID=2593676 RepID=UPI001BE5DABA|nr:MULTISPECIES: hypothetical protein [unclassified Streptomyces]MBT2406832.1 hypothetical protein [Streptomyces sp. ISL-21]MBT2612160.1 hypothetical protein [Streptomyces sp. ISL-87]
MAQFAMVQRAHVHQALRALDGVVEQTLGLDGTALFDLPVPHALARRPGERSRSER